MTDFIINPAINHPFIATNAKGGTVLISGSLYPETPEEFYKPLAIWVEDYLTNQSDELKIFFELKYIKNSSSQCFRELFLVIDRLYDSGKRIEVCWNYLRENTDVKVDGENLSILFGFPVNIELYKLPESLSIESSADTPLVYYDLSGDIIIEGNPTSSEPWEYFFPLIKWLDYLFHNNISINLNTEISISNIESLNLKYIQLVLKLIEGISKNNNECEVVWKCPNKKMLETATQHLKNNSLKHSIIDD